MRTRRARATFRRAPKTRVFWYAPPDSNDGVATSAVIAPGAETSTLLAIAPRDVPNAGLAGAAEAPHNDRFTIHSVRGLCTLNWLSALAGVRLQESFIRLGIIVLDHTEVEGGGFAAAASLGGNPALQTNLFAERSWMWLWTGVHGACCDAAGVAVQRYGDPLTVHVDVKVKRVLRQGQGLYFFASVGNYKGVPQGYTITKNIRSLVSVGR